MPARMTSCFEAIFSNAIDLLNAKHGIFARSSIITLQEESLPQRSQRFSLCHEEKTSFSLCLCGELLTDVTQFSL
jgi:hypothetical protein